MAKKYTVWPSTKKKYTIFSFLAHLPQKVGNPRYTLLYTCHIQCSYTVHIIQYNTLAVSCNIHCIHHKFYTVYSCVNWNHNYTQNNFFVIIVSLHSKYDYRPRPSSSTINKDSMLVYNARANRTMMHVQIGLECAFII